MAFQARLCDQCHTLRGLCDAEQSTMAHMFQDISLEGLTGQAEESELYSLAKE